MTLVQLKYAITVAGENSLNEAAKKLFISQPSLSAAIHSLEHEIRFEIFNRSRTGITLTIAVSEFIGYARSVVEQYEILDAKYISQINVKKRFSFSMQHYTFAVNAFVELVKQYGMDEYEFEVFETKTREIIENVKNRRSELGILYLNDYNKAVLTRIFSEAELCFTPLFECDVYVYMWKGHPLAGRKEISFDELEEYPCLGFSQGESNSFYFAEEVLSTHQYKRFIRASDRATLLNLMVGLNGFTLCSGIICEDLNGSNYCAVKLKSDEKMTIGYISRKDSILSPIGEKYLLEIAKFKEANYNE
ncbi:MAG: LysR family transcriptional regulator [Ruminococcus sp.]|nr:LysR family transcriptional regulator [Ruminococcus sp.]